MKKLSWTQRVALSEGIKAGKSNAQIARELGVHRATVGREIARNADSRESYAPQEADDRSWNRQKEAMPKRFLITFCGVEFYTQLQKRNRIYIYISRTHLNKLSRYQDAVPHAWESSYLQSAKERFMPGHAFMPWVELSFHSNSFNTGFTGSSALSASSPQDLFSRSFATFQLPVTPGSLKSIASQSNSRLPLPSQFNSAPHSPAMTKHVLYIRKNESSTTPYLFQAGISLTYPPVHLTRNHFSDVSFATEKKNNTQNPVQNHPTPSSSAVKI